MADHPNAAIVRAMAAEFDRTGDMTGEIELLSDDIVWHEIGSDEPVRGKQALGERFAGMSGMGSISVETHDVIANDEHCVQLVTATATVGDKTLVYRTAEIYHMRDGKITERWAFSDDTERINQFFAGM
jgi:ketosteroid isomerase-like protein